MVTCPAGCKAISGGFDLNNPSPVAQDNGLIPRAWGLMSSRPTQDGQSWVVEAAINLTDPAGKPVPSFWAFAACAPQQLLPGLFYVVQDGDLNPGENLTISANCDAGQVTLGGGFDFGLNPSLYLVRSERTREGGVSWQVGAKNTDSLGVRAYAWAVCDSSGALQNAQYLEDAETANTEVVAITNGCPQGTYMLAGAAGTPNSVWDKTAEVAWDKSGPPSVPEPYTWGNWTASIKWSLENTPITVHAFALCGKLAAQPGVGGGKLSGKNRGWGDGLGGGRFK